ncbi:MAG: hypothetical protein ABIP39_00495 [Polyangiaceae bacterium]
MAGLSIEPELEPEPWPLLPIEPLLPVEPLLPLCGCSSIEPELGDGEPDEGWLVCEPPPIDPFELGPIDPDEPEEGMLEEGGIDGALSGAAGGVIVAP